MQDATNTAKSITIANRELTDKISGSISQLRREARDLTYHPNMRIRVFAQFAEGLLAGRSVPVTWDLRWSLTHLDSNANAELHRLRLLAAGTMDLYVPGAQNGDAAHATIERLAAVWDDSRCTTEDVFTAALALLERSRDCSSEAQKTELVGALRRFRPAQGDASKVVIHTLMRLGTPEALDEILWYLTDSKLAAEVHLAEAASAAIELSKAGKAESELVLFAIVIAWGSSPSSHALIRSLRHLLGDDWEWKASALLS